MFLPITKINLYIFYTYITVSYFMCQYSH